MTVIDTPLVLAPMAGGPTTVALAAAVADAGGFGFLAAGHLGAAGLRDEIAEMRSVTSKPFGVNVFVPSVDDPGLTAAAEQYAAELAPWAELAGVLLGLPRYSDGEFAAKIDVLVEARPAVVSFTFGFPPVDAVDRLRAAGSEVWLTVNDPADVSEALDRGLHLDGVVAQGWAAGGHRGGPHDTGEEQLPTAGLLAAVRAVTDLPVISAGGVMTADELTALVDAGAHAVACGTAFLCSDEAGTSDVHRRELTTRQATTVTRAYTGRSARSLTTMWTDLLSHRAPAAYPHVQFLTAPLRAHGRDTGQADLTSLWAGEGHLRCRSGSAADIAAALLGRG